MQILDISPRVGPAIAVWPGDVRFSRSVALDMAAGAHLTLSSITTTLHAGAHADAPSHYAVDGLSMADVPLERYLGPCLVVRVAIGPGERILPEHLEPGHWEALEAGPRLLLHTGTFPDPDRFNDDFASLSPSLIEALAERGVPLVGLDTPSVDPFDDKILHSHRALARHDLANLEGLVLGHVPEGAYTLVALPLKLEGCDASPVRAVLLPPSL